MPYIKQERRPDIDVRRQAMMEFVENEGDLNYAMSTLAGMYLKKMKKNYRTLNRIMGVFSRAAKQFYRRVVAPYEDKKIEENGDIDVFIERK